MASKGWKIDILTKYHPHKELSPGGLEADLQVVIIIIIIIIINALLFINSHISLLTLFA